MEGGYKKGVLILATTGEYSDYQIDMVCRALKDFTEKEVDDTIPRATDSIGRNRKIMAFSAWLVVGDFVEEIDYHYLDLDVW